MALEHKKPCKIGTHSGVFHCDEVLACFMLKQLERFRNATIIRSRDQRILDTCDIVVDVGGIYDPKIHRYDHHQKDFNHTFSTVRPDIAKNRHIKLSSAGLVYCHFGMDILSQIIANEKCFVDPESLQSIYLQVYEGLIEEIDAIDNGIPMFSDGYTRYHINTHLSVRIDHLNPAWNSAQSVPINKLFEDAMNMAGREFVQHVMQVATVWWPAREIVKKAIMNRKMCHPSGEIIELGERCPWKHHLLRLEKELDIEGQIKFVVFHDSTASWRVQGVPVKPESFVCRVFLHKSWQGVRDDELSTIAGIDDCIFCHATGFIGGNKTRYGAFQMAVQSLRASENTNY